MFTLESLFYRFYLFLLLTSFVFLFSRPLRNINAMREFEDKIEYQAFENYNISQEAACHPAFTFRQGSEHSPSTSAARRLIILKNWSFDYMNRQFIIKSLDPRASEDPLHVCKVFVWVKLFIGDNNVISTFIRSCSFISCLCLGLFRKHLKYWFYAEFYTIIKPG